ncbi:transposase [Companilactobacillus sp.]|jgi:transposase|uniref:transposase n=1 Tax=Companilactobacillus sp. TaxID=2767905 RepID=UPI0025BD734E|nr:transposase [Companilactobacillus sp.]MCH4008504.1 transposase [Companilactobacillus sp.]MCH4051317.1 transposase [Companilactobacillus sp.]MCH4076447.1 transposase [Companilactobacillus sp.]MCH4125022.1 transposase [Companilactobacillus sp.]MCH4131564.1 transposase [Companilactobacillus sp.]
MTKYSYQFKLKVVKDYQEGGVSYLDLAIKYSVPHSTIRDWVHHFEINGMSGIKVRRGHSKHTQDFKLSVVDYYQTHDVGNIKVPLTLIYPEVRSKIGYIGIEKNGIVGLRTKTRGRKPMSKKPKKRKKLSPTKEKACKQEITDLKTKLYYAEMDRKFLKTLKTLRENELRN